MRRAIPCALVAASLLSSFSSMVHAEESARVLVVAERGVPLVAQIESELRAMGFEGKLHVLPLSESSVTPDQLRMRMIAQGVQSAAVLRGSVVEIWLLSGDGILSLAETMPNEELIAARVAERLRARYLANAKEAPSNEDAPDPPGHVFGDASLTLLIAPSTGGDPSAACGSSCSSPRGLGLRAVGSGGYQFGSGYSLGVTVGYATLSKAYRGREAQAEVIGREPNNGTGNDALTIRGATIGGSVGYEQGERWRGSITLSGGVFLGSWRSARDASFNATFPDPTPNVPYRAHAVEVSSFTAGYASVGARVSRPITSAISVSAGLQGLLLLGLDSARWEGNQLFAAGSCPMPVDRTTCLGAASFKAEQPFGSIIFAGGPEVGLTARF